MIEQALFVVLAGVALAGAIGVVVSRSVFVSALWLIVSLVGVAALYVLLGAGFIAAVQLLIYVGAIAVLILFTIMLTRHVMVGRTQANPRWYFALALAIGVFAILASIAVRGDWPITSGSVLPDGGGLLVASAGEATAGSQTGVPGAVVVTGQSAVEGSHVPGPIAMLGAALMTDYLLEFELVSLILLVALVGAVIVARQ